VRFRPTILLWYIVLAPFLTLALLLLGYLQSLWILFFSHLALVITTLWPSLQGFGKVTTSFQTKDQEVWLTIDDGPNPATTQTMLEALAEFEARATFFLIGENILRWPELACRIVAQGHTIGNHTRTHSAAWFWAFGPGRLRAEIDGFESIARDADLPVPALFRAPVGMKNPFVHPIMAARSLQLIAWSVRDLDRNQPDAEQVLRRMRNRLQPGSIIVLHEDSVESVRLLRLLLAELRQNGLHCVVPEISIGSADLEQECK
jgi:peptidoglycan-N-acetylglucosamine deacetylase